MESAELAESRLVPSDALPLLGKRILFTTPRNYAGAIGKLLLDRGARPVWMPTVEVWPMPDYGELDRAISNINSYQWIIFPSENGIRAFGQRLRAASKDISKISTPGLISYQPDVKVLEQYSLKPALVPEEQSPDSIVKGLAAIGAGRGKALVIAPQVVGIDEPFGIRLFIDRLRGLGLDVARVPGYQTVAVADTSVLVEKRMLLSGEIDVVVFTYSGEITALIKLMGKDWRELNKPLLAYKGPFTAENGRRAGLDVDIVPESYTIPGLVQSIEVHFKLNNAVVSKNHVATGR